MHLITAVRPVVLSDVIISALSDDAYAAASSDPSMLEDWLLDGNVILREGWSQFGSTHQLGDTRITRPKH